MPIQISVSVIKFAPGKIPLSQLKYSWGIFANVLLGHLYPKVAKK